MHKIKSNTTNNVNITYILYLDKVISMNQDLLKVRIKSNRYLRKTTKLTITGRPNQNLL